MSHELNILVNGRRIKQYRHDGKIYVEGREGSAYGLEVKNNSSHRVLAALSVDGLSVMDGERADWDNSSGYVVEGHSSVIIPGWRLNDDSVAQFTFGGKGDAYAATKGKAAKKNIGTIGCAVFNEKEKDYHSFLRSVRGVPGVYTSGTLGASYTPDSYAGDNNFFCSTGEAEPVASSFTLTSNSVTTASSSGTKKKTAGSPGTLNLGTEFGERTSHSVRTVSFNKEASPATVMEIVYSDRAGLKKMGVDFKAKAPRRYTEPKAFVNQQGCEPPSEWKG